MLTLGAVNAARAQDDDDDDDHAPPRRKKTAKATHHAATGGFSAPHAGLAAFLTPDQINDFLHRASSKAMALMNANSTMNDAVANTTFKYGAVRTPAGDVLNAALAMGGTNAAPVGAFYTEVGGYQVAAVGSVDSNDSSVHNYKAVMGKTDAIITAKWKVMSQAFGSGRVNSGGVVYGVDVDCEDPFADNRDCIIDCIKRHAPDCIWICQTLGFEACVACAGGTAACCLINCHC
jgi:hypothetical protein